MRIAVQCIARVNRATRSRAIGILNLVNLRTNLFQGLSPLVKPPTVHMTVHSGVDGYSCAKFYRSRGVLCSWHM